MTVIGIDDTDSSTAGMCTTFVGTRIKNRILSQTDSQVTEMVLTRLCPSVKRKTRGNAAVSIHTTCPAETAHEIAVEIVSDLSVEEEDEKTNPGIVTVEADSEAVPEFCSHFTKTAVRQRVTKQRAKKVRQKLSKRFKKVYSYFLGDGNGLIGATAAVGGLDATDNPTYECISYRTPETWGTQRTVDAQSVFGVAEEMYPQIWDTVDTQEEDVVAVPHTPCPILHGIRGETQESVEAAAEEIESQAVYDRTTFITNQGTDMHLVDEQLAETTDGRGYRIKCEVTKPPNTQPGGHVKFKVKDETGERNCIAFEPTKRFREYVRNLKKGDELIVCGEQSSGTIKLEKMCVRSLVQTETQNPYCENCDRNAQSEGKNKGYSCPNCGQFFPQKQTTSIDRELTTGWYEVPPFARRHLAKPLIRGGYERQTHTER